MAKVRTTKIVKAAPAEAAKKTVAVKVTKVRAAAQKAETETVFSKPLAQPLKGVNTMTDTFKKTATEAGEKATAFGKDIVEFNKANLEAVVESGKAAAKAVQTVAQNAVEMGRKNWETTTSHVKAVTGVKAPADFFQMQTEFARKQFDAAVADFSKNTEFGLKLVGEVVAPIQNRYAVVVDQVKARMAA